MCFCHLYYYYFYLLLLRIHFSSVLVFISDFSLDFSTFVLSFYCFIYRLQFNILLLFVLVLSWSKNVSAFVIFLCIPQ